MNSLRKAADLQKIQDDGFVALLLACATVFTVFIGIIVSATG